MAVASEIIQEVLSVIAPGLVGSEKNKLEATVERLISVALRSMALSLSKSDDSSIRALVTRRFNVTLNVDGEADLTPLTVQTDRPLIVAVPFLKVRGDVPEEELFWSPDPQTLNAKGENNDEGHYFYTVEALTIYTRGGEDNVPLASATITVLAPFMPNLASINDTLRSFLIMEIVTLVSGATKAARKNVRE